MKLTDCDIDKGHDPFPWMTLDHAFTPELLYAANAEWPKSDWPWWHVYGDQNARKLASKDPSRLPESCRLLLNKMASLSVSGMLDAPERLFPDLTLHGAGMHCIERNGFLKPHLDSDHHPSTKWTRELSAVLFLSEKWEPQWGGQLQLWDAGAKQVRRSIEPCFNRLVIFRCRGEAWHSVAPVRCPEGDSRKTLALFWWSREQANSKRPTAKFLEG